MTDVKRIIVVGASAGGVKAISELVSKIPLHLDTAIFIVLHLSRNSKTDHLRKHLQKYTDLICTVPQDCEVVRKGYIYLAPTDRHMLVKRGLIRITNGPHENRWRPSIDVLFRSAAVAYGSNVIGIILTGMLDDGTSGMNTIKRAGGTGIVQEPAEAEFPDMPRNVLSNVDVDYRVHIDDIGYILEDLYTKPLKPHQSVPDDILIEAEMTEKMMSSVDELNKIATQSTLTCPECGGGLWKLDHDHSIRYRCYTGHTYNENTLKEYQSEAIEESFWVSIRRLEERKNLLLSIAQHEREAGNTEGEVDQRKKINDLNMHIQSLKELLVEIQKGGSIQQDDVA